MLSTTLRSTLHTPKPCFQEQNKDVSPQRAPGDKINWKKGGDTERLRETRTRDRRCKSDLERSGSQNMEHRVPQTCPGILGADPSLARPLQSCRQEIPGQTAARAPSMEMLSMVQVPDTAQVLTCSISESLRRPGPGPMGWVPSEAQKDDIHQESRSSLPSVGSTHVRWIPEPHTYTCAQPGLPPTMHGSHSTPRNSDHNAC